MGGVVVALTVYVECEPAGVWACVCVCSEELLGRLWKPSPLGEPGYPGEVCPYWNSLAPFLVGWGGSGH